MKTILLYPLVQAASLREYLMTHPSSDETLVILEVNSHLPSSLRRPNIITKRQEDYISDPELLAMDADIRCFARQWYTLAGNDITLFDGVSFGEVLDFTLLEFFATVLPNVTYAFRALAYERPDGVRLFADQSLLYKIFAHVLTTCFPAIPVENLPLSGYHQDFSERHFPDILALHRRPSQSSHNVQQNRGRQFVARLKERLRIEADVLWCALNRSPDQRRTVYVEHYGRHADLVERLSQKPALRVLSAMIFRPSDYQHVGVAVRRARQEWLRRWTQLREQPALRQFWTYDPWHPGTHPSQTASVDLWNLLLPYFQHIVTEYFPQVVQKQAIFERWAAREQVALMAFDSPYEMLFPRLWTLTARRRGIRTVGMLEGPHFESASNRSQYISPITDYIAPWGDASRKLVVSQGFTDRRILVIGEHQLQKLKEEVQQVVPQQVRSEYGIPATRSVVLFAVSGGSRVSAIPAVTLLDLEDACQALSDFAKRHPEHYQFIFKFHPWTDWHEGEGVLAKRVELVEAAQAENVTVIASRQKIAPFLALAEVVIVLEGTTGVEAISVDKPVIHFNLKGRARFALDPVASGAAVGVYDLADLGPALDDILTNPTRQSCLQQGRQRFLQEYLTDVPQYEDVFEALAYA